MNQKGTFYMMSSGAVCWEGNNGRIIFEPPRTAPVNDSARHAANVVSSKIPANSTWKAASVSAEEVQERSRKESRVSKRLSPFDWKSRWGLSEDTAVLSAEEILRYRVNNIRNKDRSSAKQTVSGTSSNGRMHFNPVVLAGFRELYRSRDGRFVIFEDKDGHLTSVDSSRYA